MDNSANNDARDLEFNSLHGRDDGELTDIDNVGEIYHIRNSEDFSCAAMPFDRMNAGVYYCPVLLKEMMDEGTIQG